MDNDAINKIWFDFYVSELESFSAGGLKKFDQYFLSQCCYFPTLTKRQGFEICMLCNWEDDGQDEHNADLVLGGPNHDYSLTEARDNFKKYLTSYRPSDKYHFERTTVRKDFDGRIIADLISVKRKIIDKYYLAMTTEDRKKRKQTLNEIFQLEKTLN